MSVVARTLFIVVLAVLPWTPGGAEELTDDQFIESLGDDSRTSVDRRRLAKMFFGLAATLDGGKSTLAEYHLELELDLPVPDGLLAGAQSRTLPKLFEGLREQTKAKK